MRPLSLTLALALAACGPPASDSGPDDTTTSGETCGPLRTEQGTVTSDDDGLVSVDVQVREGERSFLLTLEEDNGHYLPMVKQIYGPKGTQIMTYEEWYDEAQLYTGAILPTGHQSVLNWPVREEDGPLEAGTYAVEAWVLDEFSYGPKADKDLSWAVHHNDVPQAADGACLEVRVVYADGVDENEDVVASISAAVDTFVEIYANVGIEVRTTFESAGSIDPLAPAPGPGDEVYAELAAEGAPTSLVLVVAEDIDLDTGTSFDLLGEAGNAPGTLRPTSQSAVVVSWLGAAGGNAHFNEEEERSLGETMAHEIGHFVGLQHPVTFDESYATVWWDALEDTEDCKSYNSCQRDLGANLMYPYATCGWGDDCDPQEDLTGEQEGMMHHYTGVR